MRPTSILRLTAFIVAFSVTTFTFFLCLESDYYQHNSDSIYTKGKWPKPAVKGTVEKHVFSHGLIGEQTALPKRRFYWDERIDTISTLPINDISENISAARIIFNRVPKCGSRTVLEVFEHLANKYQYNMITSTVYRQMQLPETKKNLIVNVLMKVDPPFLFERHMYYIDFRNYTSVPVKYINILRDPIERFTSYYYFKRFGDGQRHLPFEMTEEQKHQTLNECVLTHQPECMGKNLQCIVPYFCGQSQQCSLSDSRIPLEIAKRNVERDFLVVGVLNELQDTFAVLEEILPEFFKGAVDYLRQPNSSYSRNKWKFVTKFKELPTKEVKAILLQEMALEYEFFDYIKQRFYELKKSLGIGQLH